MHEESAATFKSGFEIIAGSATRPRHPRRRGAACDGAWEEIFSKKIRAPLINLRPIADAQLWEIGDYATWIKRYDTLRSSDRREIRTQIDAIAAATPLISIVMPVYNPICGRNLRAAIESVRAQLYPHWELCLVE